MSKIHSGCIPFSPEAAIWIRWCQVHRSILRYHTGKIWNRGHLKCTAHHCGITSPLSIPELEVWACLWIFWEKCEYVSYHGQKHWQKHLQDWVRVVQDKNDKAMEAAILAIIQLEKIQACWRGIHSAMKRNWVQSVQSVQVEQDDGAIQEFSGQQAVQDAIWENIDRQWFYLAEQAPICGGGIREDFGYNSDTVATDQVLNGTFILSYMVD